VDGGGGVEPPVTVKLRLPDVPPPGDGVTTLTANEPTVARSEAESAARSWVALTNVVVRAAPFQRTTDEATKPLPFTVNVSPALPAVAVAGESVLATGTGAGAAGAGTFNALQAWSVLCPTALTERIQT
jgi:hypothetical protein